MHNHFTPIFFAHAASGAGMLLSGAVAMAAPKGRNVHRLSGQVYAVTTTLVALTGFVIAMQKSNQFLIATSVFVMYMMASAYRSLYLKQLHRVKKARPLDWIIMAFAATSAIYLLALGGISLQAGNGSGIVPIVFGSICLTFSFRDFRKFTKGPADKKHWLYNHISGMIGSYIAGITAFLAVNAGYFSNDFNLAVWLGPTVLGVPYIIYTIRKYKSKKKAVDALPSKINVEAASTAEPIP